MLNGLLVLAPGGGAEVLPAGLLDSTTDSCSLTIGLLCASRIYLALLAFSSSLSFSSSLISRQTVPGTSHADSASVLSYHTFHSLGHTFPLIFPTPAVYIERGSATAPAPSGTSLARGHHESDS